MNGFDRKISCFLLTLLGGMTCAFAQDANQSMGAPMPAATNQAAPAAIVQGAPPAPSNAAPATAVNQFDQWLSNNGYNGNGGAQAQAPSAPQPTAAPLPPLNIPPPPPPGRSRVGRPLTYEEGQRAMLEVAAANSSKPSQDATIAFNEMIRRNVPLTPEQIVQLHQQIDQVQRAAAMTPNIPPKPVSSTIMVNLAPGTTPPAVRLAQGYVTSLVFVDSTGAPWPIAVFDIGNPKAVNIQWDGKSNILMMQAVSPYSYGDIVVRLVGLDTPITLELVSGQRVVDYRADIHVSGFGPNTKEIPVGTALPSSANQLLLGILDGVAPAGSKQLSVQGADCQAWLVGDKMFFRSRLTVLSPGWIGKMVSPDGMMAYELPRTSSVLVSRYGEPTELKVEGF